MNLDQGLGRQLKKLLLPTLALLVLAGCGPTQIMLRDPKTGQIVQCKPDPWATLDPAGDADRCAKSLEAKGFERLNE